MNKGEWYSILFGKAESAIKQEFYLEATWIEYSIIDDRFCSALSVLQLPDTRMLGEKLKNLINA